MAEAILSNDESGDVQSGAPREALKTYQLSPADRLKVIHQAPSWSTGPGRSRISFAEIEVKRREFVRIHGKDGMSEKTKGVWQRESSEQETFRNGNHMTTTLDKLIAQLCGLRANGISGDVEVSLAFLPIEGGHRKPGSFDVPFFVDEIYDDENIVFAIHLSEC